MKKITLLLAIAVAISSCTKSPEDKLKSNILAYLDKTAKDPKSYEFVELKVLDTVTISDVAKKEISEREGENLEAGNNILIQQNKILDYQLSGHVDTYHEIIKGRNESIKTYQEIIDLNKTAIEKAKKDISNSSTIGYIYNHTYRLKNGFGALDLSDSFISTDINDSILYFGDNPNYIVFKKAIIKK